jgi:hypothetical protein
MGKVWYSCEGDNLPMIDQSPQPRVGRTFLRFTLAGAIIGTIIATIAVPPLVDSQRYYPDGTPADGFSFYSQLNGRALSGSERLSRIVDESVQVIVLATTFGFIAGLWRLWWLHRSANRQFGQEHLDYDDSINVARRDDSSPGTT